jgi:hypothetical protein
VLDLGRVVGEISVYVNHPWKMAISRCKVVHMRPRRE